MDIVCLQEVHGFWELLQACLRRELTEWHCVHNFHADAGTASCITLVIHSFAAADDITSSSLVEGRILRTMVGNKGNALYIWNVHNFGLSATQISFTCDEIRKDIESAKILPHAEAAFILGDWDFSAAGELPLSVSRPTHISESSHLKKAIVAVRPGQSGFSRLLDRLVELKQPHPTHYSQASDALSRLDRAYTSLPGWMLLNLQCRYMLLAAPLRLIMVEFQITLH